MSDFLGELASTMQELGMSRDQDIEIVTGGSSTSGIDGDGSKWSPLLGTTKYNKDAFIVIRRKQEVISSQPMENFEPRHK